ncbi:MAG: hypothetical protein DPW14_06820 [Planctomycetes bacterium]|nr:hypothetical protein [Planctomycetota bacterium]
MSRLALLGMLSLIAAASAQPLAAERIADFSETVYLRDHETIRYRLPLTWGAADSAQIRTYVRGFNAPPRVRVLDSNYREMRERSDTSGDWIVDVMTTGSSSHPRFYVEVDSEWPGHWGDFEIRIQVDVEDGSGASADVEFVKYFLDYESGGQSDHYDCTTGEAQSWFLAALGGLLAAVWLARRMAFVAR